MIAKIRKCQHDIIHTQGSIATTFEVVRLNSVGFDKIQAPHKRSHKQHSLERFGAYPPQEYKV